MKVCIVADRGFGDHKLYEVLTEELKFDYVIRFRGNTRRSLGSAAGDLVCRRAGRSTSAGLDRGAP
jgi:hypothetical protein